MFSVLHKLYRTEQSYLTYAHKKIGPKKDLFFKKQDLSRGTFTDLFLGINHFFNSKSNMILAALSMSGSL